MQRSRGISYSTLHDVCAAWEENVRQLRAAITKSNAFEKKDPRKLKLEDYLVEEPKL